MAEVSRLRLRTRNEILRSFFHIAFPTSCRTADLRRFMQEQCQHFPCPRRGRGESYDNNGERSGIMMGNRLSAGITDYSARPRLSGASSSSPVTPILALNLHLSDSESKKRPRCALPGNRVSSGLRPARHTWAPALVDARGSVKPARR